MYIQRVTGLYVVHSLAVSLDFSLNIRLNKGQVTNPDVDSGKLLDTKEFKFIKYFKI